jgi:hypothetical protein
MFNIMHVRTFVYQCYKCGESSLIPRSSSPAQFIHHIKRRARQCTILPRRARWARHKNEVLPYTSVSHLVDPSSALLIMDECAQVWYMNMKSKWQPLKA